MYHCMDSIWVCLWMSGCLSDGSAESRECCRWCWWFWSGLCSVCFVGPSAGGASLRRLGSLITDPAGALRCNWLSLSHITCQRDRCPPRQLSQLVMRTVTCFEPFIAGIRFVLLLHCETNRVAYSYLENDCYYSNICIDRNVISPHIIWFQYQLGH